MGPGPDDGRLRDELVLKFAQLFNNTAGNEDKADVYARLTQTIKVLTTNPPADLGDLDDEGDFALTALQGGNPQAVLDRMNVLIDSQNFLPNRDDWCYADGPDAPNDLKYSRVSFAEARLGLGYEWTPPGRGSLVCSDHVGWARFQTVDVLREELKRKFDFLMNSVFDLDEGIARGYADLTSIIVQLGGGFANEGTDPEPHFQWALGRLTAGDRPAVIAAMYDRIDREGLLASTPTR